MQDITFQMKPLPPFRLDLTAMALRRRPTNIVDRFESGTYQRVVTVGSEPVEVVVSQVGSAGAPRLKVRAISSSAVSSIEIRSLLQRVLGTQVDLKDFYAKAEQQGGRLAELVTRFRGVKPPRFPSIFEALVNAIGCQQVSLSAGMQLLNKLAQRYGNRIDSGGSVHYAFPGANNLADVKWEDLRALGFSFQKSRSLVELARDIVSGALCLSEIEGMNDDEALQHLDGIRGIGRWSAEYALLRGLGRISIFPADDIGARNSLKLQIRLQEDLDYRSVKKALARWEPFQGMIYFHLLLGQLERSGSLTKLDVGGKAS